MSTTTRTVAERVEADRQRRDRMRAANAAITASVCVAWPTLQTVLAAHPETAQLLAWLTTEVPEAEAALNAYVAGEVV